MSNNIETHLSEDREFKPSKEFSKKARISSMAQYKRLHKESIEKPNVFWAREAKELQWDKKWSKVSMKAVATKPPSSGKVSPAISAP
jgi:acetyl-CoA synthetase